LITAYICHLHPLLIFKELWNIDTWAWHVKQKITPSDRKHSDFRTAVP
jgi:hypothetical protein